MTAFLSVILGSSIALAQESPAPQPEQDSNWRFVVGFGYIIASGIARFDDFRYSDTSFNRFAGATSMQYGRTYSIALEARKLPQHSWGFMGGLNYQGKRKLEKGSLIASEFTENFTGGDGDSSVQFTTVYGSAAYRWNSFYIPFGINYSAAKFEPAAGFEGTHSESGGMGFQLGIGWVLNDHFSVELNTWRTSMILKSTTSTSTGDYGTGHFQGLLLQGKYAF